MANNNNPYQPYQQTGLSALTNQTQQQFLQPGTASNNLDYGSQTAIQPTPLPYSLPMARNALADHCALAVYERRVSLKEAAKEMPGDFDLNRKLLGDVFLMSPCHMTLDQAASLAFALHEEVGGFLGICDQVGAIIPSRE